MLNYIRKVRACISLNCRMVHTTAGGAVFDIPNAKWMSTLAWVDFSITISSTFFGLFIDIIPKKKKNHSKFIFYLHLARNGQANEAKFSIFHCFGMRRYGQKDIGEERENRNRKRTKSVSGSMQHELFIEYGLCVNEWLSKCDGSY